MARKAVKGYAEKNYYDNTKFNGGVVATNDPLNEGYFKHLVNFDISDMGQSLTPRKGYNTVPINTSTITPELFISTYTDNNIISFRINDANATTLKYMCTYYKDCEVLNKVALVFTIDTALPQSLMYKIIYNVNVLNASVMFDAVTIYNYDYVNNKYVTADLSKDPYKLTYLQKFEISCEKRNATIVLSDIVSVQNLSIDSVKCSINTDNINVFVDKNTIRFYDNTINEYIMCDLSGNSIGKPTAYRIHFNADKIISTPINIDYTDLETYIENKSLVWNVQNILLDQDTQVACVVDESLITLYIMKATYILDDYNASIMNTSKLDIWLKVYYRQNEIKYLGYEGNTLIISYLDTDDIVNYIDPTKRNLASRKNIIPDPVQKIYDNEDETPDGFYPQFPMIYAKGKLDSTGAEGYLINTLSQLDYTTFIPHFLLDKPNDGYVWAYTYDIPKMKVNTLVELDTQSVYNSRVFSLDTNEVLSYIKMPSAISLAEYVNIFDDITNKYITDNVITTGFYVSTYNEYMSSLMKSSKDIRKNTYKTYAVYLVPKITADTLEIPCSVESFNEGKIKRINKYIGGFLSNFCGPSVTVLHNGRPLVHKDSDTTEKETAKKSISTGGYVPDNFTELCIEANNIHKEGTYITSNKYINKCDENYSYNNIKHTLQNLTKSELSNTLKDLYEHYDIYVYDSDNLQDYWGAHQELGVTEQILFNSRIVVFADDSSAKVTDIDDFCNMFNDLDINYNLVFNVLETSTSVKVQRYTTNSNNNGASNFINDVDSTFLRLFPKSISDETGSDKYIVCLHRPYISQYSNFISFNTSLDNNLYIIKD